MQAKVTSKDTWIDCMKVRRFIIELYPLYKDNRFREMPFTWSSLMYIRRKSIEDWKNLTSTRPSFIIDL